MKKAKWPTVVATKTDVDEIDRRLGSFNQTKLSFEGISEKPLAYVIRENDEIIAGISACIDWSYIVHIELLFVDENQRCHGLGSFLLEKVERESLMLGAGIAQTDTFDFQAKDFYLKNGYEIFGVLDDSPRPGHKRYFLKKVLK